ncbi:MAG: sugar transferase [Planctomyces sp.]|jgi:lipopolysaccharide/colanic/teichoic acid biosynthesis glycosyltransferase
MMKRLFDLLAASIALVLVSPVMAAAALGIAVSSRGPLLYRAHRAGLGGRAFTMYKLRTMHVRTTAGSSITAGNDPRVFAFGRLLRALKIDELPQLLNVIRGDMSIVGPRPEALDIVERHYTPAYHRTLEVRPGLTSPGSVEYYRSGEQLLQDGDAEDFYVRRLLPVKMELDLRYLETAGVVSDIRVILETMQVLIRRALGWNHPTDTFGCGPAECGPATR